MNAPADKPKKTITIFVNNQPVEIEKGRVTGAEIKRLAGVPAEFKLYSEKGKQISDTEEVEVKDEEKFTAISGQDVS